MKIILETPRLILRELSVEDAKNFYDLNSNPNVIKYTGDRPFESISEAETFLANYNPYAEYGYGRWVVILKESGNFIGWCGLKLDQNNTDIGFRFFEEHWEKGFATESAKACLNYGFHHLGLVEIIGRAMKENIASIKVLEKIGMKYNSDLDCADFPGVLYQISKEEYNSLKDKI